MSKQQYMAIARKWRPQTFDEVVGQEHITRTLKNAIASGRIHHAFLFIGSRGIGKTTTARILAKALNCKSSDGPTVAPCGDCDNCVSIANGTNIDVIEIDGASNNSVDDVRDIRENIRMVPTNSRFKIYIIDEVHQLSIAAFNALLKTLEEPPPHAVFVLATTEAHKIPATVISRCQRYDFRRVTIKSIVALLKTILEKENISASEDALYAIARVAEGGVRDAESILDELITYCDKSITFNDVFDVLGLVDWKAFHEICDAMLAGDVARQLEIIEDIIATGKDLSQFVEDILRYYRNLLVYRTVGASESLLRLPEAEMDAIKTRAARFPIVKLIRLIESFAGLCNGFESQLAQRTALEAMLIRASKVDVEVSLDTVMEKLLLLGAGGIGAEPASPGKKVGAPPENPPEAGPTHPAPAVPANERRIRIGGDQMNDQWRTLVNAASHAHLAMGIWLGRAVPREIRDAGVLDLEFEPGADAAFAYFLEPENREQLENFLQSETSNIKSVTLHQATRQQKVPAKVSNPGAARLAYQGVYTQVAADERIAEVLDEFKGVIVDVKQSAGD